MAQDYKVNGSVVSGNFLRDGVPKPGIEVDIYLSSDLSNRIDYVITDDYGAWQFDLSTGTYTVKFNYNTATFEDTIENVVILDGSIFSDLAFTDNPVFTVLESHSIVDVNKNEISFVNFSFSNLETSSGDLTKIEVYYKKSTDVTYNLLTQFSILTDDDNYVGQYSITLRDKPSNFDFKAIFLNGSDNVYTYLGSTYEAIQLDVRLDGVPDVVEYMGVVDIEAINVADTNILEEDTIKLQWADLKNLIYTAFPIASMDSFGRNYNISFETAKKIESYVIFMYVSDTNTLPSQQFPGIVAQYGIPTYGQVQYAFSGAKTDDIKGGTWVFMGESSVPTFEMKLPIEKYVGFWVGFKSSTTVSKVESEKYIY